MHDRIQENEHYSDQRFQSSKEHHSKEHAKQKCKHSSTCAPNSGISADPSSSYSTHSRTTTSAKHEYSQGAKSVLSGNTFSPNKLTFNFSNSQRASHRKNMYHNRSTHEGPSLYTSILEFSDFVELFKSFATYCRKDIKDLFDQFAIDERVAVKEKNTEQVKVLAPHASK